MEGSACTPHEFGPVGLQWEHRKKQRHDGGFLREHALGRPDQPHTHNSFLGCNDATCFCGKYNISVDEETVRKYCDAAAFFYDNQAPLLHMEVVGKERPLYCEDLDVLCPKGKPAEEHLLSGEFLSFRMCLMAESVRCFDVLKQVSDL